jgi:predicted house-cleaning noncanonical NTP pyrophosphatase (MazG superfamily)
MSKLVRDKIPEIIEIGGKVAVTKIADENEYWEKLKEKLKEEVEEFVKSDAEEELTDILEVIYTICKFKGIEFEEIERIRKEKVKERGSFEKRIILLEVKNREN